MTFDPRKWFFPSVPATGLMAIKKEQIKEKIKYLEERQVQIKQAIKELKQELKGY